MIRQEDLWVALLERGGQEILDDYVLRCALESILQSRGLEVSHADVQYEEKILLSLTVQTTNKTMDAVLRNRGVGPKRKSQLLWRNAALRKLVGHIAINKDAVRRMFEIVHGPKYPARIIVLTTLGESNDAIVRMQNGEVFSEVALDVSIDPSAALGGRVNPISTADPVWPSSIREALTSTQIGELSDPIYIGDRWVILTVTGEPSKATVSFQDVEPAMQRLAKLAQERLQMQKIAQKITDSTVVKIFDKHLK